MPPQALQGLRVVELGTLIAGPFAARILAEFGAEVIKLESPGAGDPLRNWRKLHQGTSLWWTVQARNKRSVAADLKTPEGQEIARALARRADVLIENFRPGTLEKWNLGYQELSRENPGLVLVRLSGFGQTGPYRDRPGFGAIGEALGGLRCMTGHPDRPPARTGVSLGDDGRTARAEELDEAIGGWTARHDLQEVLARLQAADVPGGRIYSIADIVRDSHYQARHMIEKARLGSGEEVLLPGIVPRLSATPGRTRWIGPRLGEHTAEVLRELGYDEDRQRALFAKGIIA